MVGEASHQLEVAVVAAAVPAVLVQAPSAWTQQTACGCAVQRCGAAGGVATVAAVQGCSLTSGADGLDRQAGPAAHKVILGQGLHGGAVGEMACAHTWWVTALFIIT